jgi:hypothetical protein
MFDYDNQFESGEIACDFDGCITSRTYDGSFRECIDEAKAEGWRIVHKDSVFVHLCPEHKDQEV